jgi:hypothetical protein
MMDRAQNKPNSSVQQSLVFAACHFVLPVLCLRRSIIVMDEKGLNITFANIHAWAECFKNKVLGEPKGQCLV